jgi:hypothetical protein
MTPQTNTTTKKYNYNTYRFRVISRMYNRPLDHRHLITADARYKARREAEGEPHRPNLHIDLRNDKPHY